jgi:hypothetical protein
MILIFVFASNLSCHMFRFSKITTLFTLLAYLMGFGALILYADGVYKRKRAITSVSLPFFFPFWALSLPTNYQYIFTDSPTLGYVYTMVPVLMHAVGVGMSILLKVYYDLSDSVGHLEHMAIIIRSRLWLFPGILGDLPVSKRSDLEVQRKKEIAAMAKEKKASSHRFAMVRYLKRCQFPEFRILFRSMESMPWSTVPHLSDRSLGAAITEIAQEDVYNME